MDSRISPSIFENI